MSMRRRVCSRWTDRGVSQVTPGVLAHANQLFDLVEGLDVWRSWMFGEVKKRRVPVQKDLIEGRYRRYVRVGRVGG